APNDHYLSILSPNKSFHNELMEGLKKINSLYRKNLFKRGISTQLVVGGAGESDRDVLSLSQFLYDKFSISRIYYSGFIPVVNTPFENKPSCSLLREVRLYQADFLLRSYGFKYEELIFDKGGNLFIDEDPKLVWAKHHLELFPIEVNFASMEELLRVPGIGKISAKRIVSCRKENRLIRLEDLKKLGVVVTRARNFITLAGKMFPSKCEIYSPPSKEKQLFLWEEI
ncbi:MAG: helix-hairpin-helix domain-containing protein, partial [Candidatus Omnitrophica bacterium]|nr:helix-hairpin-helix domain-containing protein [Candidatus Omnitrophota bacterium]